MSGCGRLRWKLIVTIVIGVILSTHAVFYCVSAEEFSVVISSDVQNADETFVVEVLNGKSQQTNQRQSVLIYHTHTYEAYEQEPEALYQETEKWRTKDSRYNVVAVGEALARSLTALGIEVTHDMTSFEPPSLEQAYDRSRIMLEERKQNGEVYDLIIDLHRDALSNQSTIKKTVNIGGEDVARFMVLIGQGITGGYTEKPDWKKNLLLAQAITQSLNAQCDGLARNIKIKTGRFNQHISDRCVLIECGMNTNTLDEVMAGIPYLAEAIKQALTPEAEKNPVEMNSAGHED